MARDYLCDHYTPDSELHHAFVSLAMLSKAAACIIPIQDHLGLDNSCRMNQPSTVGKNWRWRVRADQLTDELCAELAALAKRYGRMNWAAAEKIAEEDKEKKALKEKLRAEIKAELAAEAAKADGKDD